MISPAQVDALIRAEPASGDSESLRLPSNTPTGLVLGLFRLAPVAVCFQTGSATVRCWPTRNGRRRRGRRP